MKKLILVILLSVFGSFGFSQQQVYTDVPKYSFEGIKTFNGKLFYMIYFGAPQKDASYNYVIQIFNEKFERISNELVIVKYNSSIADVIEHNGGLLVYVQSGKDGLIYNFDNQGKKVWQKTITLEKVKFNEVKLASHGQGGFSIIRPESEKKDGFRVTNYDNEMNQKWTKAFFPEKGSIDITQIQTNNGRLAVLTHYRQSAFSKVFEDKIYVFSIADSSVLNQQIISNEAENGRPKDFILNEDGSTFCTGYLIGKSNSTNELIDGVFYKSFDVSGQAIFNTYTSYNNLYERGLVTDLTERLFNGTPRINFEKIIKTQNGYKILGETYHYMNLPTPTTTQTGMQSMGGPGRLFIFDFIVFELTKDGNLINFNAIGKPHKLINTEGFMIGNDSEVDDYFEDYNLFAYRFYQENAENSRLITLNWVNNTPYIGFNTLNETHENILNRIFLPKTISPQNYNNDLTTYLFKKEGVDNPRQTYQYNILPYFQSDKVVFYDMSEGQLILKTIDIKEDIAKPENDELSLNGIPYNDFKGLTPIDNKGYYTFYFGENAENNSKIYVYHQLDLNMNTTGRSVITVPGTSYFVGNVKNGENNLIIFKDYFKHQWLFYELDSKGIFKAKSFVQIDTTIRQYETGGVMIGSAASGFYIIQPIWDRDEYSYGYEVIRFNNQREYKWSVRYLMGARETVQLASVDVANGFFAILHTQRPYNNYSKFTNKIVVLDDNNGKYKFDYNLFDGEDSGFPESIKITSDNSVVTSGMYFKGNRFDAQNSDGIYFLKLKSDGTKIAYTKTSWKQIEESLKATTETDFLVSGKMKVFIEDMVSMPDGSFKIIGELYKKSVATTGVGYFLGDDMADRAFSIYDFIVFNYQNGALSSVYRIPKKEQNIKIPQSTSYMQGLSLSYLMRQYNVFSYLKTFNLENPPKLVFTNTIDNSKFVYNTSLAKQDVYKFPMVSVLPLIKQKVEIKTGELSKLEKLNNKMLALDSNMQKIGNKLEKAISGTDQTFNFNFDPTKGFAVAVPNQVVVYYFDFETGILYLQRRKLE